MKPRFITTTILREKMTTNFRDLLINQEELIVTDGGNPIVKIIPLSKEERQKFLYQNKL